MNNNFGERLKKERVKLGKGSAEFAELCGVGKNSQTNYEKNEQKPNISYLAKATELGCDLQYIIMGTHSYCVPKSEVIPIAQTEVTEIPVLDSETITQVNNKSMPFKQAWLHKRNLQKEFLAIVIAQGDAMEPNIHDHDAILIDTNPIDHVSDGIYVIRLPHGLYVKRLQRLIDGGIEIISDNKMYKSQKVDAEQIKQLNIVGKVVWIGKDILSKKGTDHIG